MKIYLIFICILLTKISYSRTIESTYITDSTETDWKIIKSIPQDAWQFVASPVWWNKKQWFTASGLVATTVALMFVDKPIQDFTQRNISSVSKSVAYTAELGGSKINIGLATSYLVGAAIKDEKLRRASLLSLSSILISGAFVQIAKQSFSRVRPYEASNQWQFNGPFTKIAQYSSFPSGHTSTAFAVASVFSTVYDTKFVKILSYSLASLTGLSRIHDNVHWASDVFMGAALGTLTGHFIAKRHLRGGINDSSISLNPTIFSVAGQNGYGLSLRVSLK
ncbi:MAG: phosphatase PAP2 family protein [Bacteroidales bacterium]